MNSPEESLFISENDMLRHSYNTAIGQIMYESHYQLSNAVKINFFAALSYLSDSLQPHHSFTRLELGTCSSLTAPLQNQLTWVITLGQRGLPLSQKKD